MCYMHDRMKMKINRELQYDQYKLLKALTLNRLMKYKRTCHSHLGHLDLPRVPSLSRYTVYATSQYISYMRMYYAVGKHQSSPTKRHPTSFSLSGLNSCCTDNSFRSIFHNKIQSRILISIYNRTNLSCIE